MARACLSSTTCALTLCDMPLERLEPVLGKYDYIFMDLGAGI